MKLISLYGIQSKWPDRQGNFCEANFNLRLIVEF